MALIRGKQALRKVLDTGVGAAMQSAGSWGQGLYKRLDDVANAELTIGEGKGLAGQLAKYFYVTHLGLNLGSVSMNMMQPLLYASVYGGLGNVLKAYGSAFKELGGYIGERTSKYGFKALTDEQHQELIGKHFKFANADGENLVQIGRDTFSTLDAVSYKSETLAGVNRRESYFFDYPMKMFEKAEWLNRNVAAHAVENAYKSFGINVARGSAGYYRMLSDVGEMVSATQFGGSTLNTPMAFQGTGPFGRLANNPLMRQFLSFPLRSATTIMYDSPRLADRGLPGIGLDFVRGMGISAVFYELGKNTFGADLSPGLFGASLTQIAGGDRFFQDGNEWVPIPPVIDIPVNLVRGALDPGQRDLIQNNLPRLIPGGIAASRTMGLLPNLMEGPVFGLPGALQKTYIDPKQRTEEGRIAVFKADGTLIDYQSPGQIFAKALGVDMGTYKSTADFDGFLVKNREQIVEYRRKAIQALLNNEIGKMQSVRSEFKRRYGMDLTISKDQLDEAIKNRTVSRTERILDRMPPDQRPMFQQIAAGRAPQMGVAEEAIVGADTARQRAVDPRAAAGNRHRARVYGVPCLLEGSPELSHPVGRIPPDGPTRNPGEQTDQDPGVGCVPQDPVRHALLTSTADIDVGQDHLPSLGDSQVTLHRLSVHSKERVLTLEWIEGRWDGVGAERRNQPVCVVCKCQDGGCPLHPDGLVLGLGRGVGVDESGLLHPCELQPQRNRRHPVLRVVGGVGQPDVDRFLLARGRGLD
jgi:hypothetical protein